MSKESEAVSAYTRTVDRIEPEIAMIDPGAGWASVSVSLKRIADSLEHIVKAIDEDRRPAHPTGEGMEP
jgi:hypothetical protein